MELNSTLFSLLGGGLIGLAVTLMLLFNGRVTGISGIIYSGISKPSREGLWRWFFIFGLFLGGILMNIMNPALLANTTGRGLGVIAIAGVLVGYGTVMGGGCTSGHGVCGISRWSLRSMVATLTFMLFGFFAVQGTRYILGGTL